MRYLKWFYGVIYKLSIDVFEETNLEEFHPATDKFYNYIMIFLTSIISGRKNDNGKLWAKLSEIDQKIPIVTFYRAAQALEGNSIGERLFNIKPIAEQSHAIKEVSFADSALGLHVESPCSIDPVSGYSSGDDVDKFVFVKPSKSSRDFNPLMLCNGKIVASQNGLNIFIGQKGAAIPREDKPLELDRPIYYLRILNNLLKKSPAGYLRLKLLKWPIALRIDDPPATWYQFTFPKKKVLTPNDYIKIIDILATHKAKITCFITPAHISKDGKIRPWTETSYDDVKTILRILKEGMEKGIIEIGCHGLTHLTIGYKPPSIVRARVTALLSKVGLVKYNLAREFYNSKIREEIPYRSQKKRLDESLSLIEKYFGVKLKAFVPPAHAWDDSTEKAIAEIGIPYFSADMNFYLYPGGHDFRKNPSPLGETGCNGKLLYVSATILGYYGTFGKVLKLFNELGIPLVWQQHNVHPSWFTPEILETFFKDLELFQDKTYMTISELGDLLRSYRRIKNHVTLETGRIICEITTEIPVTVEAYYKGKNQVKEIQAGHYSIELDL
jgi:peptidoglycan/xylan/chitin deacetylase (PgdA/CDA1 family)